MPLLFGGEFQKVFALPDGSLEISGIVSSESRDADQEVITADSIRKAIPDYMRYGAVREMHRQDKNVGQCIEIEVGDDNVTRATARITNPVTIRKIKEKKYTGFSIYGKKRRNRKDGRSNAWDVTRLDEFSVVDRPNNPDALFEAVLCKVDRSGRVEMIDEYDDEDDEEAVKVGRRFSGATKRSIGTLHSKVSELAAGFDALGYQHIETSGDPAGSLPPSPRGDEPEERDMDINEMRKAIADGIASGFAAQSETHAQREKEAELSKSMGMLNEMKELVTTLRAGLEQRDQDLKKSHDDAKAAVAKAEQERDEVLAKVGPLMEGIQKMVDRQSAKGRVFAVPRSMDGKPPKKDIADEPLKKGTADKDHARAELRASFRRPGSPIRGMQLG